MNKPKELATKQQFARLAQMYASDQLPFKETQAFIDEHSKKGTLSRIQELGRKFSGKGSISTLFDGRPWERHASCKDISETKGERNFRLAEVPAEFVDREIDEALDELAAHFALGGERFTIETEALEYAETQPKSQCEYVILALGSSVLDSGGRRYVTCLCAYYGGRRRRLVGQQVSRTAFTWANKFSGSSSVRLLLTPIAN